MTRREGAASTKGSGRSPSKKASPDLDRMVPSWRFSMLAAFARNIAGVAIHANLSQPKTAPAHH
jgi:hypothetical protein